MKLPLCTGFDSHVGVGRRTALKTFGSGFGSIALASMLGKEARGEGILHNQGGVHEAPKAKRVIFLFQAGGPSQHDLFDYKPLLLEKTGEELPKEVRQGQRLTGMSANQASLPMVGSPYEFKQHGQSGHWMSELLPHTAGIADDISIIKTMYTEAINHGPGVTFMQTGSQFPGRPSLGAWLSYGLGTSNRDLPNFVVLVTKEKKGQPLISRLWGSGFLPGKHAGVRFRPDKDAVLYLNSPDGIDRTSRRLMLDRLEELHQVQLEKTGDAKLESRIAQYEMAYRMQASIPNLTDFSDEPESTFKLYGEDARIPGTYAANCLLARRMAERGVQFVQLYHQGWDQHNGLPTQLPKQCKETDQASAALVTDLKQRGLLDDTLVIWGGEFGRTNYCQGPFNFPDQFGRDHHPRCYSMWMAGGGVKPGISYGETDEYGYNIATEDKKVHVHDFHGMILKLLGIDHLKLTFKYQGRHFRLTDVHGEHIPYDLIS